MKIKNKKTGYYYAGFDGRGATAVWVKNKTESTKINEDIVPQVIKQLTLFQYDVEPSHED